MSYKAGTVVIDIKADTAKLVTGMEKAQKSVGKSVDSIKKTIFALVGAYAGLQTAQKLVGDGFSYNMKLEEAKAGLTALSVAVQDKTIPVMERYARANKEATATLIELQKINTETPHTLDQTNQIYKAMYVSMKNAGASTSEIVELTRSLSIASGAAGIQFNSLLAGVDGLATGTVLANSDLGRFLSSLGLTNEALKNSNNVVELLKENMKDFQAADTMGVAMSNLENSWNSLTGKLTENSFQSAKVGINEFSKLMNKMSDEDIYKLSKGMNEFGAVALNVMYGAAASVVEVTNAFDSLGARIAGVSYRVSEGVFLSDEENAALDRMYQKTKDSIKAREDFAKVLKQSRDAAMSSLNVEKDLTEQAEDYSKILTAKTTPAIKENSKAVEEKAKLTLKIMANETEAEFDRISAKWDAEEALYDKKIDLQTKATDLITSDTDRINTKYLEMYDAIDGMFDDTQMQKFFKSWEKSLLDINKTAKEYEGVGSQDWTAGLEGSSKKIANIGNAFGDIAQEQQKWLKFNRENSASDKDKEKHLENQLIGYSNMTGAVANMYEEGSKEAAAFNAIQDGLALSAAIGSIASAGMGDPYTAIPRVIAMTAMMASTLSNIGVALGTSGTTTTTSYDAGAAQVANTGIGSVLGDVTAQSESIQNSLEIMSDYAKPEFTLLSSMNNSLIGIYAALSGVSSNIIKQGGFGFGSGFSSYSSSTKASTYEMMSFATAFSDVLSGAHITAEIDKMVQDAFGISFGNDLISGVAGFFSGANVSNAIIEGIFGGGSSTSTALTDAGLTFQSQLIEAAIGGLSGNSYQTIMTIVREDGGWFSSDSETISYNTRLSGLDSETQRQFELILSNLYDTVLTAGDALGIATDETKNELSDFYVNIGKISLKGKSGEQIQDTLTAIFGRVGDDMARDAFPILEQFQKVGEGFFETVSRVATDVQVVSKSLEKVGIDISSNQIIISESLVSLSGSLTTFADLTSSYYDSFFTDEEKLADNTKFLTDFFNTLGYQLPETKEGFRSIVESLDLTTTAGQESYLSILGVSDIFLDFSDALEDANSSVSDISNSLLVFANNLLYVNNVATAGYQNSMILLSNSIASFSAATDKASASADIQTYANNAISYIGSKSSSLAEQKYQTAVIGNQIRDLAIQNETSNFKTVEDAINEMKNAVVAELQDISSNTEREYA